MPRAETIAKNPPHPCPECKDYKTCKQTCQKVEDWISLGTRGRNSNVLLDNEAWRGDSDSVAFVDYEKQKHGFDFDLLPDLDAEEAISLMRSLRMKESHIDIIERRVFKVERVRDSAIALGISSQCVCHRYRSAKADLVRRMQRRQLWDYVKEIDLPPRQAAVAQLFFRDLYRVRDIAEKLDARESDISQLLLKVRDKMTTIMVTADRSLACEAAEILERDRRRSPGYHLHDRHKKALEDQTKKATRNINPSKFKSLMVKQILS